MKPAIETFEGITYFHTDQFIHVNRCYESFHLAPHKHDFIEVTYVAQGQGVHYIADQTVQVNKGQLCYIPIGTPHVFRPSSPSHPLIVYNCLFSKTILNQLEGIISDPYILQYVHMMKHNELPIFTLRDRNGQFEYLYQQLLVHYQQQLPGSYDFIVSLFIQLLIVLARSQQYEELKHNHPTYAFDDIAHYIDQHLHEALTLKQLAHLFNISERQLQRYFYKYTSSSWLSYLQQRRINKSRSLLTTTEDKIYHIAAKVGYQDLTAFTRLFKLHTGMTPSQFRKGANHAAT